MILSTMIFGHYSVLSLQSILFLIDNNFYLCIDFFHKQQHEDFISSLQSTQDVQYIPWREQVIQETNHLFFSIYSCRSLFCMSYAYFSEYAIVWWCLLRRKLLSFLPWHNLFSVDQSDSFSISNHLEANLTHLCSIQWLIIPWINNF